MNAASVALDVGVYCVKHPDWVSEATRTFEDTQELHYMWEMFGTQNSFGILAFLALFPCIIFFFHSFFAIYLQTNFADFQLGKNKKGRNKCKCPIFAKCSVLFEYNILQLSPILLFMFCLLLFVCSTYNLALYNWYSANTFMNTVNI